MDLQMVERKEFLMVDQKVVLMADQRVVLDRKMAMLMAVVKATKKGNDLVAMMAYLMVA